VVLGGFLKKIKKKLFPAHFLTQNPNNHFGNASICVAIVRDKFQPCALVVVILCSLVKGIKALFIATIAVNCDGCGIERVVKGDFAIFQLFIYYAIP